MKTLLALACALALSNVPARAQLLNSYWPLHDGDQRLFSVLGTPLTMSVINAAGGGLFEMLSTFMDSTQALVLEASGADDYLTQVINSSGVSFDNPPLFLDQALLQKGGTARTTTTVDDGLVSVRVTVTVANAGKLTVPAGTFTDCRSVVLQVAPSGPTSGGQAITASSRTTYCAPGVGIIKMEVSPGVWAELVNATVGGVFVGQAGLSPLTIQFSNDGEVEIKKVAGVITATVNSKLLQVGQSYTAMAKGVAGSIFEGWADVLGNPLSSSPQLIFTMQSNLILQANFMPNPYANAAGKYLGLFLPNGGGYTVQNCGFMSLEVTTSGAFSGYLQMGSARHALSGQLDANCQYTNTITVPGEGELGIGLDVTGGGNMSGTISGAAWSSSLLGDQLESAKTIYPDNGLYRVVFDDAYSDSEGLGAMNFTPGGPTTLAGRLADGTTFSAASVFSPDAADAQWPFYASLDNGRGCLFGWMNLDGYSGVSGDFYWLKPAKGGTVAILPLTATGTLPSE